MLVLAPAVVIAALVVPWLSLMSEVVFRPLNLWEHFSSAFVLFIGSATLLAAAVSAWWFAHIRCRSLADQLKELD
jgi:hypothetical protein